MNKSEHTIGTLFGVGVGAGDPDTLTKKAAECIKVADVLCLPAASRETCRSYKTAVQALPEIRDRAYLCLDFKMTRDPEKRQQVRRQAFEKLEGLLQEGKNLAFITVGDPTVYSTFHYMAELARQKELPVQVVNGVPSFCAAASCLGIDLCEGDEELHILTGQSDIEKALDYPGTKVIMKCGKNTAAIRAKLMEMEDTGRIRVYAAADCGMPGERRYFSAEEIPEEAYYMTTIIVKGKETT